MAVQKVGVSRVTQDQGALDGAKHVTLAQHPAGGKHSSRGERSDRVRLVLTLGPGRGLPEMRVQGVADGGSRVPFATIGSMVPRQ